MISYLGDDTALSRRTLGRQLRVLGLATVEVRKRFHEVWETTSRVSPESIFALIISRWSHCFYPHVQTMQAEIQRAPIRYAARAPRGQ